MEELHVSQDSAAALDPVPATMSIDCLRTGCRPQPTHTYLLAVQ